MSKVNVTLDEVGLCSKVLLAHTPTYHWLILLETLKSQLSSDLPVPKPYKGKLVSMPLALPFESLKSKKSRDLPLRIHSPKSPVIYQHPNPTWGTVTV